MPAGAAWVASWLALRLARGRAEAPVEAAALAAVLPLLTVSAGYDFGQREHLMAIAALPYLMLAARRMEGSGPGGGWCWASRCWPALGFALKPHFLAVPGLVEALVLLHRGFAAGRACAAAWATRCPGPWPAIWLLYLASIPLGLPGLLRPCAAAGLGLLPGPRRFRLVAGDPDGTPGTALMLLLPLAVVAARGSFGALPKVLAVAALGATVSAVVQHKGWSYHVVPVRIFAGLLAVVIGARWLDAVAAGPQGAAGGAGHGGGRGLRHRPA